MTPSIPDWVLQTLPPFYEYLWHNGQDWIALWVADPKDIDVAGTMTAFFLHAGERD